jgi:hypothetical protein
VDLLFWKSEAAAQNSRMISLSSRTLFRISIDV